MYHRRCQVLYEFGSFHSHACPGVTYHSHICKRKLRLREVKSLSQHYTASKTQVFVSFNSKDIALNCSTIPPPKTTSTEKKGQLSLSSGNVLDVTLSSPSLWSEEDYAH